MTGFIKDRRGMSMLVYYFMLTAITLMFILLQFNTVLLLNERSKIDNIGDEAVTQAAWEMYKIAKDELESTGVVSDKQEYRDAVAAIVRDIFARHNKTVTSISVTISGRYLTVEGTVTETGYKSPNYNNPQSTPVVFKFKNTAIIKGVNKN